MFVLTAYDKDNDYYETLMSNDNKDTVIEKMKSLLPKLHNDELRRGKDGEPFDWLIVEDENQNKIIGSWEL